MSEFKTNYPSFSSFRSLMELWDNYVFEENVANEIDKVLTRKKLLFFFNYKDKGVTKLYGTDDNNRMVYAMWKNPNKSDLNSGIESFKAYDLAELFQNIQDQDNEKIRLFNKKDLPKIKIITDKDDILKKLSKFMTNKNYNMDKKKANTDDKAIEDEDNE